MLFFILTTSQPLSTNYSVGLLPFKSGLVPPRLRGGAESPWYSGSSGSGSELIHVLSSPESLRAGELSKNESTADTGLPGPPPVTSPSLRADLLRGVVGGPSPAREGLKWTARMLVCRYVEALGKWGSVGLCSPRPSRPCPASVSVSCHGAAYAGTGGTGLFVSAGIKGAKPEVPCGR